MVIANSKDDIYKLESSFFKFDFKSGNRMLKGCWWQDIEEVKEKYISYGLDVDLLENEGLLKIVDFNRLFKKQGIDGPINVWYNEIDQNKNNTLWASGSLQYDCCGSDESELISFESKLNTTIKNMPVVGICPYLNRRSKRRYF